MNAILYIADDIQPLQSGKLLTVGLYPDRTIIAQIPKDDQAKLTRETPGSIGPLCVMMTILDIDQGVYQASVEVVQPDGSVMHKHEIPIMVSPGRRSVNLILHFPLFQFIEAGTYMMRVTVDGKTIDGMFQMVFQDPGINASVH